uniref:RxLR effector protein n=1 Tax=Panagrellus redivivus TaxID=6233 RepID=A0A7E4ZXX6_PANRE
MKFLQLLCIALLLAAVLARRAHRPARHDAQDGDFEDKAVKALAHGRKIPEAERADLKKNIHKIRESGKYEDRSILGILGTVGSMLLG